MDRLFFDIEQQKFYTYKELQVFYEDIKNDKDFILQEYANFKEWLSCATDKNGALQEIYGNIFVKFDTDIKEDITIEFCNHNEALTVFNCLLNSENTCCLSLEDSRNNIILK